MDHSFELIKKYSNRLPRYTSYPPVPAWNGAASKEVWMEDLRVEAQNSSRGLSLYIHLPFCEKLCTYCGCNKRITANHKVEEPYIEALLKEWDQYLQILPENIKLAELHLGGGTPSFFSAQNLKTLLSKILKRTTALPGASWSVEVHPSYTTKEQLETLYELGFRRLSLGVQSLNKGVQFLINRIQPMEEVARITEWARNIGYTSVNYDLLYGLPNQDLQVVKDDVLQILEQRPDRVAFYGYAHVPWKHPGQRRYTEKDLPGAEERFESAELGRKMFLEAGYQEIGMDHFALPEDALSISAAEGKLHRNFMGYTEQHSDMMIGLGVSSISESAYGFVQNEKHVEDYYAKLESNESLFINGHVFTEEDKLVRQKILDIMCKMETTIDLRLSQRANDLLEELIEDDIIEMNDGILKVNKDARPFLRSVCAVFDPSYQFDNSDLKYSANL